MKNKGLTKMYNRYKKAHKEKETMQARYLYVAYRKAGGKRSKVK